MNISIDEPSTSLQNIQIENIELDEINILKTVLELLDVQHEHFQVYKYYANNLTELVLFNKHRKEN